MLTIYIEEKRRRRKGSEGKMERVWMSLGFIQCSHVISNNVMIITFISIFTWFQIQWPSCRKVSTFSSRMNLARIGEFGIESGLRCTSGYRDTCDMPAQIRAFLCSSMTVPRITPRCLLLSHVSYYRRDIVLSFSRVFPGAVFLWIHVWGQDGNSMGSSRLDGWELQ